MVKPRKSPKIFNLNFSQKFFGLIEDKNENIFFIGGMYDNNIKNEEDKNKYFSLKYNDDENLIEKNNMVVKIDDYKDISLSEKSFLHFDENIYVLFLDFKRRSSNVLYYYKRYKSFRNKFISFESKIKKNAESK